MVVHFKVICRVHDAIINDLLDDYVLLLLKTQPTPNFNYDLEVIHNCSLKDQINIFLHTY